jgi:hypothetical protein
MRGKLWFLAPLALVAIVAFVVLGGEIVRLLWNWLLPTLFGWPRIGFWQALGLLALCRILFGGLGMRPSPGPKFRGMSDEQRRRFRDRMRERWGFEPPAREPGGGPGGGSTAL